MKLVHVATKRLSALLVCDGIVFVSLVAIVIAAFAEDGIALAAVAAIGISALVGLGWRLDRTTRASPRQIPVTPQDYGSEDAGLLHAALVQLSSIDLDGAG
jgi:hypothetical protein